LPDLGLPAGCCGMLICHCNLITEKEIEQAIVALLDQDPWQLIVPAKVYHSLNQRGRCCGCFPNVVETIIRVTEEYHRNAGGDGAEVITFLDRVKQMRAQYGRKVDEGRTTGHRAA
jgi:bacterioferritin-associated ferredoxin